MQIDKLSNPKFFINFTFFTGMNAAVRAVVRMGSYLGCKTYYIKEVSYFVKDC